MQIWALQPSSRDEKMKYLSICSGIEAASAAWHQFGWQPTAFAEIEPFPSAVLAHHFPNVPNLGDMTLLPEMILRGEVEAPDLLVGGTPCQAFSVAGLRNSLDDNRGQLTLTFISIADAIDHVRRTRGEPPCIIVWENVPGVLSTSDNAFGCFLGALAGEDGQLEPSGKRWTNAGAVFGPERTIAWRILNAQFFGVAQRRRRVFVVASARDGFNPAAVLFEFDGVRRDSPPSREAWQGLAKCLTRGVGQRYDSETETLLVAPTIPSRSTFECGGIGSYKASEVSSPLLQTGADAGHGCEALVTAYTLRRDSAPSREVRKGVAPTVVQGPPLSRTGNQRVECEAIVAHAFKVRGGVEREDGSRGSQNIGKQAGKGYLGSDELAFTVASSPDQWLFQQNQTIAQPISYGIRTAHTSSNGWGIQEETTHTLDQAMGVAVAQPIGIFQDSEFGVAQYDNAGTLRAGRIPEHQMVMQPIVLTDQGGSAVNVEYDISGAPRRETHGHEPTVVRPPAMQVRRLTPVECERLQGFPDNYTNIPWRGKPESPDGPRYKALGNSMAVPCMAWIGNRINQHDAL